MPRRIPIFLQFQRSFMTTTSRIKPRSAEERNTPVPNVILSLSPLMLSQSAKKGPLFRVDLFLATITGRVVSELCCQGLPTQHNSVKVSQPDKHPTHSAHRRARMGGSFSGKRGSFSCTIPLRLAPMSSKYQRSLIRGRRDWRRVLNSLVFLYGSRISAVLFLGTCALS